MCFMNRVCLILTRCKQWLLTFVYKSDFINFKNVSYYAKGTFYLNAVILNFDQVVFVKRLFTTILFHTW